MDGSEGDSLTSQTKNPFYINKREYDDRPLFFLPKGFSKLEQNKPVYVVGSRGTGKTTLLKALSWEERTTNQSLMQALGREPFSDHLIGLYFRLPGYISRGLYDRPSPQDDGTDLVGHRFSLYMELIVLQLLTHALCEIRRREHISFSAEAEVQTVDGILEMFPGIRAFMNWGPDELVTLSRLRVAFFRMHGYVRASASKALDLDWAAESENVAWLRQIGPDLLSLVGSNDAWRVKICLDEAECLSSYQQRVVNTWARLLEQPITLVVAYANRPWNTAETLIPNVMNSDDDVFKWDLDVEYSNDPEFKALACGVASVRLSDTAGETRRFSLDEMFDDYSVNGLLVHILRSSSRADLRDRYLGLAHTPADSSARASPEKEATPRVYQKYIKERLAPSEVPEKSRRAQDSAIYRKTHIAALICFCREFGFDVPYAGASTIIDLSDSCIRDFLRQMSSVFDSICGDLETFLSARLDIDQQSRALRLASKNKFDQLQREVDLVDEVSSLIRGVGHIVYSLQSSLAIGLRVPGRGIVRVQGDLDRPKDYEYVLQVVREAEQGGLVRITRTDERLVEFVLHRLLSPLFSLSYRRPSYPVVLGSTDMARICKAPHTGPEATEAVQQVIQTLLNRPLGQMELLGVLGATLGGDVRGG